MTELNIFDALAVVHSTALGKITVVFETPHQWQLYAELTGMVGFQDKDNKILFYFKQPGQQLVLGDSI